MAAWRCDPCVIDGCPNNAAPRRRMCYAHEKRRRLNLSLTAPLRPNGGYSDPWERVVEAFRAYEDAAEVGQVETERARSRLRQATLEWVLARHPGRPAKR